MPLQSTAALTVLPHTVSDLLVALGTSDSAEILIQVQNINNQADACEAVMLRETALKIRQAALTGNFDVARSFITELNEHLHEALASMSRSEVRTAD